MGIVEHCDVLVVGGGGAALRAAIAAYEAFPHVDVLLVTKGALGHSGVTATACSDRMAFHATLPTTEPGGPDAWRYHSDDIYRMGGYVSDADLACVLARGSAEACMYLERLGVPWARRADGTLDQFVTDGSRYARACYTGPYTAQHIEQALLARLRQLPVRVWEHQMVGELLLDADRRRVCGAALVSERDDTVTAVSAGAVILATGGAGRIFEVNVYPADCTGDGYALAYRAGAELVNLEFIQLGLCSLKTGLACSGSMMRALPRLVNDRDEEFLWRYLPDADPSELYDLLFSKGASWPVSAQEPSHIIDVAVASELRHGQRVWLDYARDPQGLDVGRVSQRIGAWYGGVSVSGTERLALVGGRLPATPLARLRGINAPAIAWLAERGIDLDAGERIEIAPAAQHFQGGVKIRTQAETSLTGLHAAGEAAGGQHGANRPGGNALLDAQVFGKLAGEAAARYAVAEGSRPSEFASVSPEAAQAALAALLAPQGVPPDELRASVARAMSAACGVHRTEQGLRALADQLALWDGRGVCPGSAPLVYTLEARNVVQVARLIASAALARDESRGPHLRFAADDSTQLLPSSASGDAYIVIRQGHNGPDLQRRRPVAP